MSQALIDAAKASVTVYNDKDWAGYERILTADAVYDEVATGQRQTGAANIAAVSKAWAGAFPDSKASFDAVHVSGNTVILELTWRGTHRGALQMASGVLPPTGRKLEVRAIQVIEVTPEGKVRSVRHYFDVASMLSQVGVSV